MDIIIAGKNYSITTSDEPEYIRELALKLSDHIDETLFDNENLTLTDALVLVSLNLLDDSYKESLNVDNIRSQIKTYVDDATTAKLEAQLLKNKLAEAEDRIHYLETEKEFSDLRAQVENKS
jgi:Uncharacterized protein conserved in bacteria